MSRAIKEALQNGKEKLAQNNIQSPVLDAEVLLAYAIQKSKEFLYTHPEHRLLKQDFIRFDEMLQRRIQREPVAYITNKKEFYGYEFYVDKRVLIPRPETERLVQNAKCGIQSLKIGAKSKIIVIDVGVGSGSIIISLVKELLKFSKNQEINQMTFIATDISADALAVAKINAKKQAVEKYIKLYKGGLLEPVIKSLKKRFTRHRALFTLIITANLPYITPKTYQTLSQDIKDYEPPIALLTPNEDKDYFYKKLDEQIDNVTRGNDIAVFKFYEN